MRHEIRPMPVRPGRSPSAPLALDTQAPGGHRNGVAAERRLDMWMDSYFQETLMRERIADAQERATRRRLLRIAQPPRAGNSAGELFSRLVGAAWKSSGDPACPTGQRPLTAGPAAERPPSPPGGTVTAAVATPSPSVPTPGPARTRLLLEGPIVRTLLRLGAPNVLVNVVLIAVTATVDAYFVGKLGSSALAGLALVFPVIMLMQQMANGSMGGAIASAVARAVGAGRRADASALVIHGLVLALAMAILFTAVVLVAGPTFYRLMGGSGPGLEAAVQYSTAIFAGAVVYWMLGALTSAVRGSGHAAILAVVYLAAELLHVV